MISFSGTYTDLYELTMAQVYYYEGYFNKKATFDYYFRSLPFNGGFAIFCGLEDILDILENFQFTEEDLEYLKKLGFKREFINYLKNFKFQGTIYSCKEGEVIFPDETIVQVEGNLLETQIIETVLLNILNFETLIATKASRIRLVAKDSILVDFGLRRAQGPAGYYATRSTLIGGFDSTSNVYFAKDYNLIPTGTMAHSFIQSFENELQAFRIYAKYNPDNCVLLIDTYDTLNSGIENAIKVAKELEKEGYKLKAIRIDSGDLAYLSKECRKKLNNKGLEYVKIIVSNQLDEYIIKSLVEQNAPIDIFGVGTNVIVGKPDAALDGVYKLSSIDNKPSIKISNTLAKTTIPERKQVYRLVDKDSTWIGDIICLRDEDVNIIEYMYHPFDPLKKMKIKQYHKFPLLTKVMENGKRLLEKKSIQDISNYVKQRLNTLPEEYKRFINPHVYKIGLSEKLHQLRNELILSKKIER